MPRTHFPLFGSSSVGSDRYDSRTSRGVERCFTIALHASGCQSELNAARMLGYTQVTWDDYTGEERQPASLKKFWHMLTAGEKAGANALGYTQKVWDDRSSKEMRPASHTMNWAELTTCGKQPSYCPLRLATRNESDRNDIHTSHPSPNLVRLRERTRRRKSISDYPSGVG